MKDMLEKQVLKNDEVVYVGINKKGKIIQKHGKVVGFTKNGVKVQTEQGIIRVKNIVKINNVTENKIKQNKQFGLLKMFKTLFNLK